MRTIFENVSKTGAYEKLLNARIIKCDIIPILTYQEAQIQLTLKTSASSEPIGLRMPGDKDTILGFLEILQLTSWNDLKDSHLRLKYANNHVVEIGHIIENNWYILNK